MNNFWHTVYGTVLTQLAGCFPSTSSGGVCVFVGPQPYPMIHYAVANPVRSLLNRNISEEHLQSSKREFNIPSTWYIFTSQSSGVALLRVAGCRHDVTR